MSHKFMAVCVPIALLSASTLLAGCSEPVEIEVSESQSLPNPEYTQTPDTATVQGAPHDADPTLTPTKDSAAVVNRADKPDDSKPASTKATPAPVKDDAAPDPAGGASDKKPADTDKKPAAGKPAGGGPAGPSGNSFIIDGSTKYSKYHHNYDAVDVQAKCGSPALSPASGTVSFVSATDTWDKASNLGPDRGGIAVAIDAGATRYYMSHLQTLTVTQGQKVTAGSPVGTVGDTGSAAGTGCHIHFGLSSTQCSVDAWWIRRGRTSPYTFLRAWESGEQATPDAAVKATHAKEGCLSEEDVNYQSGEHR